MPAQDTSPQGAKDLPGQSIQKMAVLFTDVVGSSKFFKSHGDVEGRQMLKRHQGLASAAVSQHGGIVVKTLGDSAMAYFMDAEEALKCAIRIQEALRKDNQQTDSGNQTHIRIGIHYGNGIVEDNDIFGNVVNMAAKVIPVVGVDEIYVSGEVHKLVHDFAHVSFELVDLSGKSEAPEGVVLYRAIWEEGVKIDPIHKILLYLKPIWNLANDDFSELWDRLFAQKDSMWGGKVENESILSDRSVAFILATVPAAMTVAQEVNGHISKALSQGEGATICPVHMIIDSGPYLGDEKVVVDGLKVNWEDIDPGEIYVSSAAYELAPNKEILSVDSEPGTKSPGALYKLVLEKDSDSTSPRLFSYHDALTQGKNRPCFYCGDRRHLAVACPSKSLPPITRALNQLGYLSFDTINKLFFDYVAGGRSDPRPAGGAKTQAGRSARLAYHAYYDLKRVFQLRFFMNIWNAKEGDWEKCKQTSVMAEEKGGDIWIGTDCLRVSKLAQAEMSLEMSLARHPTDYRPYCAMGFLNVEKQDLLTAQYYFVKALDYTKTKPQKILVLLLLCRLNDLDNHPFEAVDRVGEILGVDSRCTEAMYQDVIFKFREKQDTRAVAKLVKLIHLDRQFFVNALIDSDLAPFSELIHPVLKGLFEEVKAEALEISSKAETEYNKLEQLLGEEEIKEARSVRSNLAELSKTDGYFTYLDIIHYGKYLINVSRRSLEQRRTDLAEVLYGLNRRVRKNSVLISKYPYRSLIAMVYHKLTLVEKKIGETQEMSASDDPKEFRQAFDRPQGLSAELDEIESRLNNLKSVQVVASCFRAFVKRGLIFMSANVLFAIAIFPVFVYYLNIVMLKYRMSRIDDIWAYQKVILIVGGICALVLAFARTIKSLDKKGG